MTATTEDCKVCWGQGTLYKDGREVECPNPDCWGGKVIIEED